MAECWCVQVVGYLRVSTDEQGLSGAGLSAQEAAIRAEVERRGWELAALHKDVASGGSLRRRSGLADALARLDRGDASALIVARLDRLSRSVVDFGQLLERAQRRGWAIVALDLGVDMTTASGALVANVMSAVAAWERAAIAERTRHALAARRSQGVRLGRPPAVPDDVRERVRAMRAEGATLRRIAAQLAQDGIPTAHGGRWAPETIKRLLARQ
jgi:DNA invertase Pin-like site-specific DNA recombinase